MMESFTPSPERRSWREQAEWIVEARNLLIVKVIADLREHDRVREAARLRFLVVYPLLPLAAKINQAKYLTEPVRRKIEREGVLAQDGVYEAFVSGVS